ncbi:hypothetical protein EST38_g4029 [Candolleomyces aberdarensis]|uniref:Uncharacterized protein n=1 Tax=Candolleomyces aberdarensis TaxID=2316362 RepID=A0A4Q2DS05_9AGAR|nr:hypothetical protein EST38_g4029 [Candolleomyces aberdarensis]
MSDSDSSSASSSSRSPSPVIKPRKQSKKIKDKSNTKHGHSGKNEGVDPNWDFKPPPGRVELEAGEYEGGELDWDALNDNEDLEVWVIRAPAAIKAKYLDGLNLEGLESSKSLVVGNLKRKTMDFDVWSVGEEDADGVVGEEIRQLSCLVPRKKKGKLYRVPRGIARRLVLSAGPAKPQAPSEESLPSKNSNTGKYQNPPRHSYPDELLTHSFAPYGSHTTVGAKPQPEDVDMDEPEEEELEPPPPAQPRRDPEVEAPKQKEKKSSSKGKKRKGEGEDAAAPAPKKSKKSKSSA